MTTDLRADLRTAPSWRPELAHWAGDPWDVALWAEPSTPGTDTFDDYLVSHRGPITRLAVLDAVVNLANPDAEGAAHHGTMVARRHFRSQDTTPAQAMLRASDALCDPDLRPRNRNSLLTAAIADLHPDGTVEVAVSGDSEVWVRTLDGWTSPAAADMLSATGRAAWAAAVPDDGSMPGPQMAALQEALLDDFSAWDYPCLGFTPAPRLRSVTLTGVLEVIVSTDGSRLTAERCADLAGWLSVGLQLRTPGSVYPSPHGDITVLHAALT